MIMMITIIMIIIVGRKVQRHYEKNQMFGFRAEMGEESQANGRDQIEFQQGHREHPLTKQEKTLLLTVNAATEHCTDQA